MAVALLVRERLLFALLVRERLGVCSPCWGETFVDTLLVKERFACSPC